MQDLTSQYRTKLAAAVTEVYTSIKDAIEKFDSAMIGVSQAYVSKFERDECPPPAEDNVRLIAEVIGCDVDELLARGGKVSTDLKDIIKRNPIEVAALLRATKGLTSNEITRLAGFREVIKKRRLLK